MADSLEIACEICQKKFTQKVSLKRHYAEIHPGIELPENIQNMKDPKETCANCLKEFSKASFKRHLKKCEPEVEQPLPSSSAAKRKTKAFEKDDTYKKDFSIFHESLPIEPMLHDYYSEKWLQRNFDRKHIDRYIAALKRFEKSYASQVELTPTTLLGRGLEDFQSRLDSYFNSLQKVSDRQEILFALERTFEMLQDEEICIINNAPKIPQLVPNKGIIKRYFNSSLRKEYFQKIESNAKEFLQEVGPIAIRNFLLTETILATKSSEFVHQLTREMFQRGTSSLDDHLQKKWIFEIGHGKLFEIPDFLQVKLQTYLTIVREHVLQKKTVKQDGKDDIWDPHTDNEVKFFAVSERGRPFVVEVSQSVFEAFYAGGQSHKKFLLKDFTGCDVQYRIPNYD